MGVLCSVIEMLTLRNILRLTKLKVPSRKISSWQLTFNGHGEPLDVLQEKCVDVGSPKNNQVLVNYRASPINPSDINAIQGVYPLKPSFPAIGGNEGAGYVSQHPFLTSKGVRMWT